MKIQKIINNLCENIRKSLFGRLLCIIISFLIPLLLTYFIFFMEYNIDWLPISALIILVILTFICLYGYSLGIFFIVEAFKLAFESDKNCTGKKEIVYPDWLEIILCCILIIVGTSVLLLSTYGLMKAWSL